MVPVQSDATISPVSVNMLATTITPFSIFVKVTVSSPSLVWCGVKDSSTSQASTSYLRSYGSAVTDAKTFVIARLQPNTNYPLLCVTIPIDSTNEEDVHSRTQNMMTGDAIFQLTGIRRTRRQVTFHISSNVDATYVCYLMTRKPIVLSTIEVKGSEKRFVSMDTPNMKTPLMTKCEMYDKDNNLLMSTDVEDIDRYTSIFVTLRPYFIIILLISAIVYIWKKRKVFDPTKEIEGVSDVEKMGLLKKMADDSQLVKGYSKDVNLLDDNAAKIRCERCGFVNAKSSTVCKECNALLKGTALFNSKKETQYY